MQKFEEVLRVWERGELTAALIRDLLVETT